MKAAVLVQSTNKATYEAVLNQIISLNKGVNDINWVFIEIPKNRDITPSDSKISERHIELKNISELKKEIKGVELLDVTGLSKENLIRVFATIASSNKVPLYTLSKNHETGHTNYVDLTEDTNVTGLLSTLFRYKKFARIFASIALVALVSLVVLWLLNFDSSAPFITWLGIFYGILGIALTFLKT